jgi:hypothetical protein
MEPEDEDFTDPQETPQERYPWMPEEESRDQPEGDEK